MLYTMLAMGVAVGVVFPLLAGLIVTPKGPIQTVLFWLMSIAAGIGIGAGCWFLARRTSELVLKEVLVSAGSTMGVAVHETRGIDGARDELDHVFANVTTLLTQIRSVNSRLRVLAADILAATEQQVSGAAAS